MADKLLEKMTWQPECGQIMDQDRRYVMLRADVLMGIFQRLPPDMRGAALGAFFESVRDAGGQSAKSYFQSLNNDPTKLLDTMASYSAELGWGKWSFAQAAEGLRLTVHNSPFAAGYGDSDCPVCHPIAGMLTTVAGLMSDTDVYVEETQCASQTGVQHCSFQVRFN